jgi:hypothetical protein
MSSADLYIVSYSVYLCFSCTLATNKHLAAQSAQSMHDRPPIL